MRNTDLKKKTAPKKTTARIAVMLLSLVLAFAFLTIPGYATVDKTAGYGYTITIYAGLHGHFGQDKNNKTLQIKAEAGKALTVDLNELDFTLDDNNYYVRGLRQAGHDNDEIRSITILSVDEDISYEVAYGIKGGMVQYVINYLNAETGEPLRQSDTYYGMAGDKPVVSYKYIEKYMPDAYNKGKTLVEDESQNVFNFRYHYTGVIEEPENVPAPTTPATPGNDAQNNNAADNGAAQGADNNTANNNPAGDANADGNDNTTFIDDGDTPQAAPPEYVDLDDGDVPLAGAPTSKEKDSSYGKIIAIIISTLVAIALILFFLLFMKRRKKEEEAPEEAA